MALKAFLEPVTYTVVENIQMYQPKLKNLQYVVVTYEDDTKQIEILRQTVLVHNDSDASFSAFFALAQMEVVGINIIKQCYLHLKTRPGFSQTTDV